MSQHYENATTSVPPLALSPKTTPQKANRLYPVLSLLSVILLFISAGAGIALSAVVLFQDLESTEVLDPLSRAVFFVASCMSLVYVFTHLVAGRTAYIKNYGSPTKYGKYVAGFAFLLARLGLPVWVAAITLSIFVAVNIGLDLSKGVQENLPWLNVIISISSLFSLAAVLAVIEMADRPFATLGISQAWFIRGEDPLACPDDDDDLEPGVVYMTPSLQANIEKHAEKPRVSSKPEKRKRKTLTKRNPHEPQRRALRHARSISMPTPLNAVFGDRPGVSLPDSPVSSSAFAWKPPTRDGATPKAAARVALDDWVTCREHASMRQGDSDISTNASAQPGEVILPSMPRHAEYSPRSQALLEEQGRYDSRRWTAIGMQSPPINGRFLDIPFRRPLTPLMTMEEENRLVGRRPSTRDGDWEANYHLQMRQASRPASSRTTTTFRSSRYGLEAIPDHPPSLPHIATLVNRADGITNSIRPDSNVLPNEGRRRRRISSVSSLEGRRLTYRTESRVISEQSSRPSTRPPSQHPSIAALATRPASPTSTVRSIRSDVHNFSRPRTSAAARMQSKVARRLRALKQQETENARRSQVEGPLPASPSTPISPATPRTVRAAAVKTLQDRLGKRNLKKQAEESPRPATPETPRTARATAVRNLQERLGKRMMRRNEEELTQAVY
ncbi:hypothetical protein JMJ77_0015410 [Colletotrichum scovillei]|uniref:Uncharacterized protein n=2 Tax=Colletotrichum scovillei TaxID=1209932 RepID=A0A9P7U953_9PEZI|nr:hypothetical protein JMJ77_0015410 [Colletotrichum scovillei]KAG7057053.1 hypothetical protein JMJ78_0000837 [Colletotrichum scovillei]KAG7066966.1 hypothetical protein JMJ76_0000811 [Colletotrichum scovillei]